MLGTGWIIKQTSRENVVDSVSLLYVLVWQYIYRIWFVLSSLIYKCLIESRLSDRGGKHGQQLSKPSHYIKIMLLYIPHLSCIYGPNIQMSNREQVLKQRGQTWSTAFKAKPLHQKHVTLYTTFILHLRTQYTDVESRAGYQTERALSKPSYYIKIMVLYIPHLSCISGLNLEMSNREQVIRHREKTWSTAFKAKSLHKIMVLYIPHLSCI